VSQNSQLHLTNDSFIYACQSEFAARSKKDGTFNSHLRFEDFLTGTFSRPGNPTIKDVARIFAAIAKHHTHITPQFRRREPINLDTVAYFTCAIATLFADLESACKEFFGVGLPVIPETPPEYSADAPVASALLIARSEYLKTIQADSSADLPFDAFPRPEFATLTGMQQSQIWSCEIWDLVADVLHTAFGEYADATMGFAYWKYQEVPAKTEIDWRVRPPVGEAYAKAFKPLQRNARGDRGDRGGDRRGRDDRPPRDRQREHGEKHAERQEARPPREKHAERQEARPPREKHAERPEERAPREKHAERTEERAPREKHAERPEERGNRGRHGEHDRGDSRSTHGRSDRRSEGGERHRSRRDAPDVSGRTQSTEQQLNDALAEVRQAAETLKNNPALLEVQLIPNNSFIRRQQHSLAVEMGFDTESRGEGRDRGVVLRLPQA